MYILQISWIDVFQQSSITGTNFWQTGIQFLSVDVLWQMITYCTLKNYEGTSRVISANNISFKLPLSEHPKCKHFSSCSQEIDGHSTCREQSNKTIHQSIF